MNEITATKTISPDQTHIDYTRDNFGVRVWKDKCQAIARADVGAEWGGRGRAYPLPVDGRFRNLPIGGSLQPVPALALEIGRMGNEELTRLASGEMSFDDAVSTL